MLNIQVRGRQIKYVRFILAGSCCWLVLPGKQEPDPEILSLYLHFFCPFWLLLPSLERKCCRCIDKQNGFFRVTVPRPGYRYILQWLLCSGASFFNLLVWVSVGVLISAGQAGPASWSRSRRGGLGCAELADSGNAFRKPGKPEPWKAKLKGTNVEELVNVVCLPRKINSGTKTATAL